MSRGEFRGTDRYRSQVLAQFQTQVPKPLSEDLKKLLSTSGMRHPAIGILLTIFIGEHRLKGAAMQIQIQHIFGTEGRKGQG